MADINMAIDVYQDSQGKFTVYNRSTGQALTDKFSLKANLKHSKGDVVQTVTIQSTDAEWSFKAEEDGWFEIVLERFEQSDLENPIQTYRHDSVSMLQSYKCLNDLLLQTDCQCDMDLDRWIKIYVKINAIKASACNCLYAQAQCMIENLKKICKGC